MRKRFTTKHICILGLTPISLLLIIAAKSSRYFTEQIYVKYIYRWISQFISSITGLFPFSVAELIIVLLPFAAIVLGAIFLIKLLKEKQNRGNLLLKGVRNVLCAASMILFLFTILGGLNYYRYPVSAYSGLEVKESSLEELAGLMQSLTLDANELRAQIKSTDEEGVFQLSMSISELVAVVDAAYDKLAGEYPVLAGNYGAPKPVLLSELMSKTEITGIFIPFTMEANVNVAVPDYTIPATMLHEQAHQRGFMREDEANFLAYLAGMASDQPEVQYSSTMLALITAGNALYDQSTEMYFEIRELFSDEVIKDIRANSRYWAQYEDTVVSTVSNKINDTYLKVNAQEDGVKSYGRMLDLLLAKYRKDRGPEPEDVAELTY